MRLVGSRQLLDKHWRLVPELSSFLSHQALPGRPHVDQLLFRCRGNRHGDITTSSNVSPSWLIACSSSLSFQMFSSTKW